MNISYSPDAMEAKRLNAERIQNRSMCKPDKPRNIFPFWAATFRLQVLGVFCLSLILASLLL